MVDPVIRSPLVLIASDGGNRHARNTGSFARTIARYVRDQGTLTLNEAIRKMTLMPAKRLESSTPLARHKGRIQVGMDADIAVFDLATIQDHATYRQPMTPSTGVKYVLVAGTLVVDGGRIVSGVEPGRAVTALAR